MHWLVRREGRARTDALVGESLRGGGGGGKGLNTR